MLTSIKSLLLLVWCYFGNSRGREIAKCCYPPASIASSYSEVRYAIFSNNNKKYGKYTPKQKAMIAGQRGVVANLCIPDRFTLVINSYHSFHFETRGHCSRSMRVPGVWFRHDPTTLFLPRITTNPSIQEIYISPEKYPLYGM